MIPNAIIMYDRRDNINQVMRFTFGIILVWSLRLALHIGRRHKGEDYRYKVIKKNWENYPSIIRFFCAFFGVFGFQGLLSMIVNASAIHIMIYSGKDQAFGSYYDVVGGLVWYIGFMFEAVGDSQLQEHRNDPAKKGTLITTGLWRYTRHPNYFGEACSWWGIYIICCGTPGGQYTIYSPILITFLLRYVSGVSMLETQQKKKAEFRIYMDETSAFIPFFYTSIIGEKRKHLLEKYTK